MNDRDNCESGEIAPAGILGESKRINHRQPHSASARARLRRLRNARIESECGHEDRDERDIHECEHRTRARRCPS